MKEGNISQLSLSSLDYPFSFHPRKSRAHFLPIHFCTPRKPHLPSPAPSQFSSIAKNILQFYQFEPRIWLPVEVSITCLKRHYQRLLESLSSWNQIKPVKPVDQSSFTEIFGELHFKEDCQPSLSSSFYPASSFPPSSLSCPDLNPQVGIISELGKNDNCTESRLCENKRSSILDSLLSIPKNQYTGCHKNGIAAFSPMNHESLQLCTESLGFESSVDVENTKIDTNEGGKCMEQNVNITKHFPVLESRQNEEFRRPRTSRGSVFPPPISCIGKNGKPEVRFKSYRHNGRFVLKELKIPTLEFLHACREDGRLKLHFVHSDDEILGEAENHEEGEDEIFTVDDEQQESEEKCLIDIE